MITDTAREGVHANQDADELRDVMVDEVIVRRERLGLVPPRKVEAALRTVPRHLFAPGVPLEKAYTNDSIVTKRNERGVGTVRKGETFGDLDLWLARLPEFCLLSAKQEAVDRGLASPYWHLGTPALVNGDSLAYCTKLRPVNPDATVKEFGVYAHGPNAGKVADRLAEQIQLWDRDHRRGLGPRLTVHPADTPDAELPSGLVIDRRHTRIVISWPGHPR